MKILEVRYESPDIFEMHEFEDITAFKNYKKSINNSFTVLMKKLFWLILLVIFYVYLYITDFVFSNIISALILVSIFIFYLLLIFIYKPEKPGREYLFILDEIKKELIIEGISTIMVFDPLTKNVKFKELANTDGDKLKLSLNQTLKFELIKEEDNPTLNEKFKLKYGKDFVDKHRRYVLKLCLLTRNYKEPIIELYKTNSFSELSPLEDGIFECWESVTEKLNRFLNS
jgi:hypothetical protein